MEWDNTFAGTAAFSITLRGLPHLLQVSSVGASVFASVKTCTVSVVELTSFPNHFFQ